MLLTGKLLSTSQDPAQKTLIAICSQILKSRAKYSPLCISMEVCASSRRELPCCSVLTMQLQTAYKVPQPWGMCVQGVRRWWEVVSRPQQIAGEGEKKGLDGLTSAECSGAIELRPQFFPSGKVLSLISLEEVEQSHEAGFQCFRKFCAWVTNGTATSQGQGSCVFPWGLDSQILWFNSLRLYLTSWQCFLLPLLKHASSHTHTHTHIHSFSKLKWIKLIWKSAHPLG